MEHTEQAIKGLEFIRHLDGLQLLGVFFILFIVIGLSVFFILLKKGYIKLKNKEEINDDSFKPSTNDANVTFFETRVWMKDRVLSRHLGWIFDAYPKDATSDDREKLEKVLRYAELESKLYTNYIIKRNQFGKMSDLEFKDYLEKIPLDIIMHVSRNISSLYKDINFTISRETMLENTTPLIPKCVKDLAEMFVSFRDMERRAEAESIK